MKERNLPCRVKFKLFYSWVKIKINNKTSATGNHIDNIYMIWLLVPERQKASTPLRSQSAKKRPGSHKLIRGVLSFKHIFNFLKSDHN